MRVLKPENKRKDYKLVGASMSPQVYHYLNLFILTKKITKTAILSELLEEWIKKQRLKDSENSLILNLVEQIKVEWKIREAHEGLISFDEFSHDVMEELTGKGLSLGHINAILTILRNDAENKKRRATK